MIERLQRAIEHIEELSSDVQEQLAEIIEQHTAPRDIPPKGLVGAWSDLPDTFDEMLDTLERNRHASAPTPPTDEQLAWLDEDDSK
jgi:hypothetical protein